MNDYTLSEREIKLLQSLDELGAFDGLKKTCEQYADEHPTEAMETVERHEKDEMCRQAKELKSEGED